MIKNDGNINVFGTLFPSKSRALAFLYKETSPEKWMKYIRLFESQVEETVEEGEENE